MMNNLFANASTLNACEKVRITNGARLMCEFSILCKKCFAQKRYLYDAVYSLLLVHLQQKKHAVFDNGQTKYTHTDFHYYYRIANTDGELFWRRIHAEAERGEKSNKAKSEHGKSLLLISVALGMLRQAESLQAKQGLFVVRYKRSTPGKNDSRRRALTLIWEIAPLYPLVGSRCGYDLKIIA